MDSLGGYRLVRRLGTGTRSRVWLGSDGTETVAIKVFNPDVPRESIDAEIEVLGRVSDRHIVALEGLSMGPDGIPCLILQRLSAWNLGRVVSEARPGRGEAVNLLAPLCLTVAELHRRGIVHGRIRAGSVLFDDSGAPVLASFGDAQAFGPSGRSGGAQNVAPVQLTGNPAVFADLAGLARMCLSVLEPDSEPARWLSGLAEHDPLQFARELADRLFQYASPEPVQFSPGAVKLALPTIPPRLDARQDAAITFPEPPIGPSAGLYHVPDDVVRGFRGWIDSVLSRGPIQLMKRHIIEVLRPVRKPVWIMAAVAAAGVIAAASFLSSPGASTDEEIESAPTPSVASLGSAGDAAAIAGEDPVAAAGALLRVRDGCIHALSVPCLDSVDQQDSAAMDADEAYLRQLQDGGAENGATLVGPQNARESSDPATITVVERLGDTVLLTTSGNAAEETVESYSLLIIKLDEGWRIRDLIPSAGESN